jgi:hypothetical protein
MRLKHGPAAATGRTRNLLNAVHGRRNTQDAWSLTALPLRSSLPRSRYGCSTLGPRLEPTTASARAIAPA